MPAFSLSPKTCQGGYSLVEAMVGASLLAVFFAAVFELNGMCLRTINSTKETLAALQAVHDRSEMLRNLSFTDLTNTSVVQNLLTAPANAAPFLERVTEVVTLTTYPSSSASAKFTRWPNGTVTANSVGTNLGSGLVKVDVALFWTSATGNRARSEQTSSIVANGTKK